MKIFVDTNIFLDIALKRDKANEGLIIFKAVKNRIFDGTIADITIINIDYIARKVETNINSYLSSIEKYFEIVGADNSIIKDGLNISNRDLEDNIQYLLAKKMGCEYIITNDKGFYKGDIDILNSTQFINRFLV